jgi:hypothetical protein
MANAGRSEPRPYKVVEPAFSDAGVKGGEVFAGSDGATEAGVGNQRFATGLVDKTSRNMASTSEIRKGFCNL